MLFTVLHTFVDPGGH